MLERNVMGFEGFYWAIGVVEDRQDPLALGRVRARAWGIHTDSLTDIPTDALPWAQVSSSVNLQLKEGDSVLMFFADGRSCQIPVIISKLEGFFVTKNNQGKGFNDLRANTVLQTAPRPPQKWEYKSDGSGIKVTSPNTASPNPLSTELGQQTISGATRYDIANTVIQQRIDNLDKNITTATGLTWSEPYPAYNPLYPYNKAYQSESGHIIEVDDTPGNERLTWTHRTGSFRDMYPSGTVVEKVTKSKYSIVMGDDYVHIMGRCLVTIGEGAYIKIAGDANIECDGNLNLGVGGDFAASVGGAYNVKAKSVNIQAVDDATVLGDTVHITGSGEVDIVGSAVNLGGTVNVIDGINIDGLINLPGTILAASIDPGPGPANPASAGSAAAVPSAPPKGTPNSGSAGVEPTPVPFQQHFAQLNSYTGLAYKYNQLLNPDGTAPDANVPATTQNCSFDPQTHTFLPQPWAISQSGIIALQQREGLGTVLANGNIQAYPDPPGTNSFSIGYGVSAAISMFVVNANTVITRQQASDDFSNAINSVFLPALQQYVTVDITQNMVDALLSFMYNVGVGGFAKSSVLKYTNSQDWCAAYNSFKLWNKSGGVVNSGLTARRQAEANQYIT